MRAVNFEWFKTKAGVDPGAYVGRDDQRNEQLVREQFTVKAKRFLKRLPLAEETVALYFCLLDAKTPRWVKATVAVALAYFILPIDAIPDLLPIVGLSDDASVITAALMAVSSHLTDEHRARAREWMNREGVTVRVQPDAQAQAKA